MVAIGLGFFWAGPRHEEKHEIQPTTWPGVLLSGACAPPIFRVFLCGAQTLPYVSLGQVYG
jgi:hypothetical protein